MPSRYLLRYYGTNVKLKPGLKACLSSQIVRLYQNYVKVHVAAFQVFIC